MRIGVLGDQSGLYSDNGGPGSVAATKMAVEDFGGKVVGRPIEVLTADHQNKTDIGVGIAREWYESKGVDVIVDFAISSIALAVQDVAKKDNKIAIYTTATSDDLVGKSCSSNGQQWGDENWSNTSPLMTELAKKSGATFFFVTADYTFGAQLEDVSRLAIEKAGGKVVGSVKVPLNSPDMSSYLLSAQSSGADVVVLAIAGGDVITATKQAMEFGITPKQSLATPIMYLSDVNAIGLKNMQNIQFMQSWYWDADDKTRAWAKKYFARMNKMPNANHAALYSAVTHYLKAVAAAGTTETTAVLKKMHEMPISDDAFTQNGNVQANGRAAYDRFLVQAKAPQDSKYPWDYLKILSRVPAAKAFQPADETPCPLR
ncbi:ABC transporter substrate-binding protein [Bradyrhizobium sp. LTSP885]|uniref:ABC transporter substrate-binding protein n=1 Tax=Bradyrhizobium sp. LTSP885 TaxID=1619232 RepID=UPI0018CE7978|nr:ABC transporter substrate-binding protein [Bradyrhizobium sp. LTSP885]